MITLIIVASIGSLITGYSLGKRRYKKEIIKLKNSKILSDKIWEEHCKAIRRHYLKALIGERKMKKIIVNERKYYVELDKIHLIYEDDKLVGWYRPDIEEVEGE